jgi:hypothetical protein
MSATSSTARRARPQVVPREILRSLTVIPGIGPSLAADLYRLGVHNVRSLRGRNPENLYRRLCRLEGRPVDRCVLYTFRCAVYFAAGSKHDREKLKWWNWMDKPAHRRSTERPGSGKRSPDKLGK